MSPAPPTPQEEAPQPGTVSHAEPSINNPPPRGRAAKAKGQPKRRPRTRSEIPITEAQLESMETTIPSAGTFLPTSTHLNFQVRTGRIALTYARCPIPIEDVFRQLSSCSTTIKGMRGVIEAHRDGTPHVHVIVQKSNSSIPYRSFILEHSGNLYRCDVRTLSTKKYQVNWHEYCAKHNEPSHWGDYQIPQHKLVKTSVELVATAVSAGIPEALSDFLEGGGGLQHISAVRKGLEIMTAPEVTSRFVPPPLSITLRPWQNYLWEKLNEIPKVRRIFWAWGVPKSGKTTFTRYLEQEYAGGIVNMGECTEMARALQAYRGHALVIWDFPKSHDWSDASRVGTVLETFSEFGSFRRSTMYGGERVQMCNHVLCFANVPPIEQIKHRTLDVLYLDEVLSDGEDVEEAEAVAAAAAPPTPAASVASNASTLQMGPVYDPCSGRVAQLARERSRSRG